MNYTKEQIHTELQKFLMQQQLVNGKTVAKVYTDLFIEQLTKETTK